jgi:hypothetical protein
MPEALRFNVFGPTPFDPELTRLYEAVPAIDHLHAVLAVHRDALGSRAVRILDGVIVFADPVDQLLYSGEWRIIACGRNNARRVEIEVPAVVDQGRPEPPLLLGGAILRSRIDHKLA